jgi:hypothetical protein
MAAENSTCRVRIMNYSKLTEVLMPVVFGTFLAFSGVPALHAQQTRAKRNILTKQDLSGVPDHEGVLAQVELHRVPENRNTPILATSSAMYRRALLPLAWMVSRP